jgi:hypothetical protein
MNRGFESRSLYANWFRRCRCLSEGNLTLREKIEQFKFRSLPKLRGLVSVDWIDVGLSRCAAGVKGRLTAFW